MEIILYIIVFLFLVMPIANYFNKKLKNFLNKVSKKTDNFNKSKNIDKNQRQLQYTLHSYHQIPKKSQEEIILNDYGINYIYHMTHIDNLTNILQNGILAHNNSLVNIDISNKEVNDRRNSIEPIYHRNIHSYVPFYFNPKNAMLYSKKDMQGYLVILAIDKKLIYQDNSLFTDGNAAASITKFYKHLTKIQYLNWNCLNAKTWFNIEDGKRMRMAEVLVFDKVQTKYIQKIYCNNNHIKQYIENLLPNNLEIKVEVNTTLFF